MRTARDEERKLIWRRKIALSAAGGPALGEQTRDLLMRFYKNNPDEFEAMQKQGKEQPTKP